MRKVRLTYQLGGFFRAHAAARRLLLDSSEMRALGFMAGFLTAPSARIQPVFTDSLGPLPLSRGIGMHHSR